MIITKEVKININVSNIEYFKTIGYENLKIKQSIIVPINKLMKKSKSIVIVKCDKCGFEHNIPFSAHKNPHHCKKCSYIEMKKTKLKKYGDENYVNLEKCLRTKLERYGDKNYNNKEKNKQTCLEKYGNKNYNNNEKNKQTCLEKYGVENPSQLDEIKNKKIQTCLKNFKVEHPLQNGEIYQKLLKFSLKLHKSGLYYQSGYEEHFLNSYHEKLKIGRGMRIIFTYKGKQTVYYPDYYLPDYNLIIEIKSNYYYRKKLNLNLKKKKQCELQGYNFIFIIDKKYEKLEQIIKKGS